jgi:hypothetical protein
LRKLQDAAGFTHFPLEWPRIFLGEYWQEGDENEY